MNPEPNAATSHYVGGELDLFAQALTWKRCFESQLRPYIRGDVLEVGAGIGSTTASLYRPAHRSWTCLEPDPLLVGKLTASFSALRPLPPPKVITGTAQGLTHETFDTALYIDVLEHIQSDREELQRIAGHVRPNGFVVVLAPAHQFLYTPFDAAIGHYRRYNHNSLAALAVPRLALERIFYLDSVGLLASLANKLLLRQSLPTARQIAFWDHVFVPVSRVLDPLLCHRVGKTVVGIWRRVP